jgi:hypothetical protein
MRQSSKSRRDDVPGEMVIVDTFTKLIFAEDAEYSDLELLIIEALRNADHNVSPGNYRDMGVYLRALGVDEMIALVTRVQEQLATGLPVVAGPVDVPGHPQHV